MTKTLSAVSIAGEESIPVYFPFPPVRAISFEQWSLRMPRPRLQSLLEPYVYAAEIQNLLRLSGSRNPPLCGPPTALLGQRA